MEAEPRKPVPPAPVGSLASGPPPVVSVIIPTYNWSSVLRYAIQSVLWQTFQDFELLVIGDACTDDSAEVVAGIGDPRIRWRNLTVNSGSQSGPNNAGLALARGQYVAYLGHDDVWHPTHLAALVQAIREQQADVAFTQCVMIGPPESGIRKLFWAAKGGRYVAGGCVPVQALLHRKEMAHEIGGWRDYRAITLPPDREFVLRAHQCGNRFVPVEALTAFKFNATLRRNSYREKPCHEQGDYVRRIQAEPDFLEREWRAIREAQAQGVKFQVPDMPPIPDPMPPGWLVEQWRRIRGLDASPASDAA